MVLNGYMGGRGWWHRAGGSAWLKVYLWTLLLYFWTQGCIKSGTDRTEAEAKQH